MSGILSRKHSLKKRRHISALFGKGQWIKGTYFTVIYLPAEDMRCLYTAPRMTPTAVERNRRKRYARETVNRIHQSMPQGHYGFILKKIPEQDILNTLENDLLRIFHMMRK